MKGGYCMSQESLLTAQDVAARLGVCGDGLRAYKVGRCIRFKAEDVDAYLEAQAVKPPEPVPGMAIGRFRYKPGMKVVSL